MDEKHTLLVVNKHADALPILVKLEAAGIDTDVVGQSTPFSKAASLLFERGTRHVSGELGQLWRIMVPESNLIRAREILTEAGLMQAYALSDAPVRQQPNDEVPSVEGAQESISTVVEASDATPSEEPLSQPTPPQAPKPPAPPSEPRY